MNPVANIEQSENVPKPNVDKESIKYLFISNLCVEKTRKID